jgi:hypothetical protein
VAGDRLGLDRVAGGADGRGRRRADGASITEISHNAQETARATGDVTAPRLTGLAGRFTV